MSYLFTCLCTCQDGDPEVEEKFLLEITGVALIDGVASVGAVPSVRRPGNVATITIAENDNAGGIIAFNVERVSKYVGQLEVYASKYTSDIM